MMYHLILSIVHPLNSAPAFFMHCLYITPLLRKNCSIVPQLAFYCKPINVYGLHCNIRGFYINCQGKGSKDVSITDQYRSNKQKTPLQM